MEVWNRSGEKLRAVADVPMADRVPQNGVITGPRAHRWTPLDPATLIWVEALDQGDIRNKVPHRDQILALAAPFSGEPSEVARTEYRYGGASWTDTGTILLTENDRDTRTTRTWVLDARWAEPRKLWDRKQQDRYGDPGNPVFRPGRPTILQAGDAIYLNGAGASADGERPFLDRLNLRTFATERLFRSDTASFESIVGLLDENGGRVLTRRENRTLPPNYFIRDLRAGPEQAVTNFNDPHPQLTKAMADRLFVTYKRKDGVGLSGTIYLPAGYQKGQRVPMLVWAYPAGVRRRRRGGPGRRLTEPLHARHRAVTPAAAHAGLRGLRRSDDADRRTGRDGQRQVRRAARRQRRGRGGQGRRARHRRSRPVARRRPQLRRVHDRRTCSRTRTCSPPASRAAAPTTGR